MALEPHVRDAAADGVLVSLGRLARLELELGLVEVRRLAVRAAVAAAVAVLAAVAAVAGLVLLLAAALAPLFGAPWPHLAAAGAAAVVLAAAGVAWARRTLRGLGWPRLTLASLEENWRWLATQLRSRLTLR